MSPRRRAELRAALQMAVGAIAALLLATALKLPHPYWSVISAIVVIQTSVGSGVLGVARDRALGTVAGALAGALVAVLRPEGMAGMAGALAVSTAVLAFLGAGRPWLKLAPVTAAIVIAGGTGPDGAASLAFDRVMEILVGSAVGVAAILVLFPRHAQTTFKLQARDAAGDAAALLRMVLKGDPAEHDEIRRRHNELKNRLNTLDATAKGVFELPGAQRDTADRAALVRAFWRVRSDIVILGRAFQTEGQGESLEAWATAARRVVERLEALSQGRFGDPLGAIVPELSKIASDGGDDLARGAAAIGLVHMHRDLDDLAERFKDLRLV